MTILPLTLTPLYSCHARGGGTSVAVSSRLLLLLLLQGEGMSVLVTPWLQLLFLLLPPSFLLLFPLQPKGGGF